MLKKSKYNVEIDKTSDGGILLFNTFTGAFGILEGESQEVYLKNEQINIDSYDSKELQENLKVMSNYGFLVDFDLDETLKRQTFAQIERFGSNDLALTIAPTLFCNMACPYCYEQEKHTTMSLDTQDKLLKFVEKYMKNTGSGKLFITWYGGEPLLALDTIRNLSKGFLKICEENEAKYEASIITNGILFTENNVQILKDECKVRYAQITIDGLNETHNKRRLLKNGQDSFKIITENIGKNQDVIDIVIRINVDKENIKEGKDLVNYFLLEEKWGERVDFYFSPIVNSTDACNYKTNKCFNNNEFGEVHCEMLKYIYEVGKSIGRKIVSPIAPQYNPCGFVSKNSFVVDPEGSFYKCWNIIGIEEHRVGDLESGVKYNNEHLKWLNYKLPEKCDSCNIVGICNCGCPYEVMHTGKDDCHHNTVTYTTNLKLTYQEYIGDNPE